MNDRNRQLKQYYRAIRNWLPGSAKQNKLILEKICDRIDAYAEENPEAGVDEIKQRFGTPRQIAAACVDEMGMEELLDHLRTRKKVSGIIRNVVICLLVVMALLVALSIPRVDSIDQVPVADIGDYPALEKAYENICRRYGHLTIETDSMIQIVTIKNLWGSWDRYILPCFAANAPTVPRAGMQSFTAFMHILTVWEEENLFTRLSPLEVSINTNMLTGDYTALSEDFRVIPEPAVKSGNWIVFEWLDCEKNPSCFVYYWVGTSSSAAELDQEQTTTATFQWKYVMKIHWTRFGVGNYTIDKTYTVNA